MNKKEGIALTKTIFALGLPTMLEEVMGTAVQYVDTFMVGSLGTAAVAAVGSTTTVNWLIGSSVSALGVGFLAFISRSLGAGDENKARRAAAQAVFAVITAGLVFSAATHSLSSFVPVWMHADRDIQPVASRYFAILYTPMLLRTASIIFGTVLRAAGDTKTPMKSGIAVNVINVALNFLLIYKPRDIVLFGRTFHVWGAAMGVEGAAAASAVSVAVGGIFLTAALLRHPVISPLGYRLRPDGEILRPCLRVALPNMLQRFCTSFGYVVFGSMINGLGLTETAAHTVANTVESAFYIPGYGMQSAAATLTGNCLGADDRERLKKISRTIVFWETVMMIVSGGLLFAFAPSLAGIFSKDAAVIALGSFVLRMVAVSEPFYGVSIVTEGMLQGAGKTTAPFIFNVICMWGIRILGTFVLTAFFSCGLKTAWGAMIAGNMTLLVLFRLYFRSLRKNGFGISAGQPDGGSEAETGVGCG